MIFKLRNRTVVSLVVVLVVANISMNKKKHYAMAAEVQSDSGDAPMISWLAVLIPVLDVVLLDIPIILGFMIAGIWALLFTGKLRGGYKEICRQFAKLFTDGATDVAPMVGFLMTLAMFNNSAAYASSYFSAIFGDFIPKTPLVLAYSICYIDTTWVFPWSFKFSWFWFSHSGSCFSSESNNACCLLIPAICNNNDCAAAFRYYAIMGSLGLRLYKSIFKRVYEKINSNWLDNWSNCLYDHVLIVW